MASDVDDTPPSLSREAGRAIFGGGASGYHAARSGYPAALFAQLGELAARAPRILEIGPGSGLATDGLLSLVPSAYVGIESDAQFVEFLRARFTGPQMRFINAPFPCEVEGPFDLATCAAAFHWLEPDAALAALRRLLRPGGIWAMWWNSYLNPLPQAPFAARALAILGEEGVALPPSFSAQGHIALDVEGQSELLAWAGMVDISHTRWDQPQQLDTAATRALFESFSFIRALGEPHRERVMERIVRAVAEEFGGEAHNIVITSLYTARNPV